MKKYFFLFLLFIGFISEAQLIKSKQIYGRTYASLTDGATISWDLQTGFDKSVTLGGNRTLSITNAVSGDYGTLIVSQDATGGRTLAVPNGSVTIDTSPNAVTVIGFTYDGTTFYWAGGITNSVDSIYRTVGVDSIKYTINGRYHAILDSAGGGGLPAGSDRQVQYNNAGAFGASSNLVYNAAGELIVGGTTDNGAFKLQSNGGLYSNGGQTYLYGGTIFLGDAFSQTKSSGDILNTINNTTTTGISIIQLQSGNGATSAKFNYLRFFNNNTAAQKWDFGTYGSDAIKLRDVTGSITPLTILNTSGYIGLKDITTPTSFLDLPPSTTSAASLRIESGASPTSPNEGDVWNDGTTHHLMTRLNGVTYQLDQQSASTPTLQQVTDAGASTTNNLSTGTINFNFSGTRIATVNAHVVGGTGYGGYVGMKSPKTTTWANIFPQDSLYGSDQWYYLPDNSSYANHIDTLFSWRDWRSNGVHTLSSQYTDASNSGTTETDLMSYTTTSGQLANDGDRLEIEGWFVYAANADLKTLKFKFGAYVATISSSFVTSSGGSVKFRIVVTRTGATSQKIAYEFKPEFGTPTQGFSAASETLSGTIVTKFTGTSDTASSDITFLGGLFMLLKKTGSCENP